jgi:large subunit ribosomal protein L29
MKAKDMREKSTEDLAELEKSITREAFQARFKNFTARLDDTSSLKKSRRDVARVKTILAERTHIGGATPSASDVAKPAAAKVAAKPAKSTTPKAAKPAPKTKASKASEATK